MAIGTTAFPGYRLTVDGTIGCRELEVTDAVWADHVFSDDEDLALLVLDFFDDEVLTLVYTETKKTPQTTFPTVDWDTGEEHASTMAPSTLVRTYVKEFGTAVAVHLDSQKIGFSHPHIRPHGADYFNTIVGLGNEVYVCLKLR